MNKNFHTMSREQVLKELETTANGLQSIEAKARLGNNGKNILPRSKKKSALSKILVQLLDPMIIVLIVASIASLAVSLVEHTDDYIDSIIILCIVIFNAIIGYMQEQKAENAIEELKKLSQKTAKVVRDGKQTVILVEDLVVGDKVIFEAGDIIPADLYLIETVSLKINESSLTGESNSVDKMTEQNLPKNLPLGDRKNMAYSSSVVVGGRGVGVVVATGKDTELGKIADLLKTADEESTLLQRNLAQLGKVITAVVLAVASLILFLDLLLTNASFMDSFMTAVAIAVAAIPESLPAVVTIIMAVGVTRMSKRNAIVKRLHAVETLGACEVICTDKTGTLTQNNMVVKSVFLGDHFENFDKDLTKSQKDLLNCMLFCNDSVLMGSKIKGDPTETALVEFAHKLDYKKTNSEINLMRVSEIPFDSNRKLMTTVHTSGANHIVYTKGAVDSLLDKCTRIMIDDKIVDMTAGHKIAILQAVKAMGGQALRVLAFAKKIVRNFKINELENDLVFLGLVGMQDPPRPQAKNSVKTCKKAGMIPVMITGDHADTAFAIAKELGIAKSEKQVMTGQELDRLSDEEFVNVISKITVYARVSPQNKVRIVQTWKKLGKIVAMTGDGVNDAPSLKSAHIGIGMGITGTDVTKEVADVVLADDDFSTIVIAVEEGRRVFANIQKTIQFLFSTNITEVVALMIATIFFPDSIFLLPLQILFINLATDILPAIALGFEPTEEGTMSKKPRKLDASVFSDGVGKAIIYQSTSMIVISMAVFVIAHFCFDPAIANTMVFLTICLMQTLHMLNVKSHKSVFKSNPFTNKWFILAIVVGIVLTLFVALVPPIASVFGLVQLNLTQWLVVIASAFAIFPVVEVVKFVDNHIKKVWIKNPLIMMWIFFNRKL